MPQICNLLPQQVHHGDPTGWVYTIFAIAIAASEVAIGLAIFLAMYGKHETISLDDVDVTKELR